MGRCRIIQASGVKDPRPLISLLPGRRPSNAPREQQSAASESGSGSSSSSRISKKRHLTLMKPERPSTRAGEFGLRENADQGTPGRHPGSTVTEPLNFRAAFLKDVPAG